MLKDEYPKAITDLLGIPAMAGSAGPWMSAQGTVLKEWLLAVGNALDVPYQGEKTRTMRALVEAVGEEWDEALMTSRRSESRGGGNIATPAFEALLRGLHTQAAAVRRAELSRHFNPYRGPSRVLHVATLRPTRHDDVRVWRALADRRGQGYFRARLLEAYGGRCAVTDCDAPAALEAAHVVPYSRGGEYEVRNGLLLRADLHTLFDLGLMSFDARRRVLLHPELDRTTYASLRGRSLREPVRPADRVPDEVLAAHRRAMDL